MTTTANLSPAFVQLFDSEVHQAYQGNAVLQNVRRMRTGVVGNTVNFPKIGKGQATLRKLGTDVVPLNTAFTSVSVSMSRFCRIRDSDIFLQTKINFDELGENWQP